MKWIKCSDILPEHGERVLVNYGGIITIGKLDGNKEFFHLDFGGEIEPLREISHWMPLPEPPDDQLISDEEDTQP